VRTLADGEVTGFVEKPSPDQIDTHNISAGVYVLERSVLELLEPGQPASIERDVFPRLVGEGLFAYVGEATGSTSELRSAISRARSTSSRAR
jgi:mannose-1-phosphate guanylyltransferase